MVDVNRRQKRRAKNQLEKEEEKPKREKKLTEKEKAPKKNEREKDLNIYNSEIIKLITKSYQK